MNFEMFSKCRACLNSSNDMKLLSGDKPENKQLISMFTSVACFEWIDNENIAPFLCRECELTLEISYKFQKKCQESHELLKKFLQLEHVKANEINESDEQNYDSFDEKATENVDKKSKNSIVRVSEDKVNQAVTEYKRKQKSEFRCIACNYVLTTLRTLSIHMTQNHRDLRENWCYLCNRTYHNLLEHRKVHKNPTEQCQFCNKIIKKKSFLDHLRAHSEVRPFECSICGKGFIKNSSLKIHQKRHKRKIVARRKSCEDKDEKFKIEESENILNFCKECNRNVRSLSDHNNKIHYMCKIKKNDEIFSCHICNKELKSNSTLQMHLRLHRGETPYKCSYCGKVNKSRAQLIDHERTHTGEKPFICNVCGKGFSQSGALGTHMRQHTGRPVVCKICQKRFCRPSELKLHLKKHSGEKPYLCTECGKAFVQKSHLTEHTKTHSDRRPHQCSYCEKAFKQKSLLTSHLQIHSGYKRFKCAVCSYACFKSYRLQQHMKLHNNQVKDSEKVHVCPICHKGYSNLTLLNTHKITSHNAIM